MVRWGQIIRLIVGILLIPLCVAAAIAFGKMAVSTGTGASVSGIHVGLALVLGAVAYALIFIFFYRSIVKSVFSKEPVTVMWGTVTGYRLPSTPQEQGGGSSKEAPTDTKGRRVPLWAVLVPYLIPIYTVGGALIVWIVKLALRDRFPDPMYRVVQAFVLGLTYAFHVLLLFHDIHEKNPHLRSAGYLFTMTLLFVVNLQVLAALAMIVFNDFTWWVDFNRELLAQTVGPFGYGFFWNLVRKVIPRRVIP